MARRSRNSTGSNLPAQSKPETNDPDSDSLDGIISRLPPNTPLDVVEKITQMVAYSGPIPPPHMFAQYEQIQPGAADRILSLAENEQGIRKRDNGWFMLNDSFRVVGSIFVSLALVGAGVYCGMIGQPELGGVLGASGAVSGVVKAFMSK